MVFQWLAHGATLAMVIFSFLVWLHRSRRDRQLQEAFNRRLEITLQAIEESLRDSDERIREGIG